ncbi:hypothetical protein [Azospirillum cavernae]|uniref:hypothetical protein n=1 Tax=Azospirillum cavernae TaxID=2320860 RepID=UPI0011C41A36|nr:hypothetical protein [Azospirillum cavernae]
MKTIGRFLIFLAALAASEVKAACPQNPNSLTPGCPWDANLVSKRFELIPLPTDAETALLERYNHTYYGCFRPANKIIAAYSRYENGRLIMIGNGDYLADNPIDRVLLSDILTKKSLFNNEGVKLQPCSPPSSYLPTPQNYTAPEFKRP